MAQLKIPNGAWVVVCDGRKALILENAGDAQFPNLKTIEAAEQPDPPTRDLGTDRPGRSFASVGTARSAVEQTDWHDQEERNFVTNLAKRLDEAVLSAATTGIVIVAPPRALGVMRKAYSNHLRQALIGEVDKDLVSLPVYEIEEHLFGRQPRS